MPDDDMFYPPAQYDGGWLLWVLAVVAAGILVTALVLWLTRPRHEASTPANPDSRDVIAQLRVEYQERIADVETKTSSGELDPRRAHAEVSRLMRAYVNEYSGLEAPVLTLQDLVALDVRPELTDALQKVIYPSVFRRDEPLDPALAVEAARKVLASWR